MEKNLMNKTDFINPRTAFAKLSCSYHFAVVLKQGDLLAWISIVTATLSLLGSGSIIVFAVSRRICRSVEVRPLLHLSIADLFLAICWIVGACFHLLDGKAAKGERDTLCFVLQALTETITLSTFLLTTNYAMNVFFRAKLKYGDQNPFGYFHLATKEYNFLGEWYPFLGYILSWMVPIVLFIPMASQIPDAKVTKCQRCIILLDVPKFQPVSKISPLYGCIILVSGLSISIIGLLILYSLTYRILSRTEPCALSERQKMELQRMKSRLGLYTVSFIFCCVPALVLSIGRLTNRAMPFSAYILQVIFTPLQGFLNSIVYGWTRRAFLRAEQRLVVVQSAVDDD